MYYLFDGSYAGFLCCLFESFERKEFDVTPLTEEEYQTGFFQDNRQIITDVQKASRVQKGLGKILKAEVSRDFYKVFLSEDKKARLISYKLIIAVFKENSDILLDYGNENVLYFSQVLNKVNRESHRMKAFVRFRKGTDGLYFSVIEPDFNVLPLIAGFFKKRYADQQWLIYDVKRQYGLLYDEMNISEVKQPDVDQKNDLLPQNLTVQLDDKDELIQRLWQQYFKSTNIESRKNIKLHLQHVPKRYWKYLTEKNAG